VNELSSNLPQIITAAAQSLLGILALLALALSVLAYFFFASASEKVKVGIFAMLFLGVTGFGVAMFGSQPKPDAGPQVATNTPHTEPAHTDPVPVEPPPTTLAGSAPLDIAPATGDAMVGHWTGRARDADGGSFEVDIRIDHACTIGQPCGTIRVSGGPCQGRLTLKDDDHGDREFSVDHFSADSAASCTEGAGEHLRVQADGALRYTTTYDPRAHATLAKAP
jgi:hypothetical protein